MAMWECPACGRPFGKVGQGHVCAPGLSLDAYYVDRPAEQRAICDAIIQMLEQPEQLGPVTVEPVGIGILFKKRSTFAELRPRRDHQSLNFGLLRDLDHDRVSRHTAYGKGRDRFWLGVPVHRAVDIDEQVNAWLA